MKSVKNSEKGENKGIKFAGTRRSYLKKAAAGAGFGMGGVTGSVKGDDTVEMVVVQGSDGPRITRTVSADWYHWEEHVERAAEDYRKKAQAFPGIKAVGIGSGLTQVGGRSGGHLRVYADSSLLESSIPDTYNEVPIETIEYDKSHRTACDCNHAYFDPIPGGVTIEENASGAPYSTTACKVEKGGTNYIMTVSHLFTCDFDDIKDWNAFQFGSFFGTIAEYDHSGDWAIVQLDERGGHTGFNNTIQDYNGILSGHVTYKGLTDFMGSNAKTAHQHGITTCKRTGKILDRDFTATFEGCNPQTVSGLVQTNIHNEPGDSGGPVFDQYTYNGCDYIAMIGHHIGGTNQTSIWCSSDYAYSNGIVTPAYQLYNDHSINFDPDFELGWCKT